MMELELREDDHKFLCFEREGERILSSVVADTEYLMEKCYVMLLEGFTVRLSSADEYNAFDADSEDTICEDWAVGMMKYGSRFAAQEP